MFSPEQLLGYLAAVIVLVLVPGPNTALILTHSLGGGVRSGLATVAGVELATVVHTLAAALGLSAIVATSALAFDIVKLAGAAALIVMGIREIRAARSGAGFTSTNGSASVSGRTAILRALVGNMLNPKVAIFFLAFLPQWVEPARGSVAVQLVILGAIVSAVGAVFGCALAVTAGSLSRKLASHAAFWRWQRRVTGGLLVGLGLRLAWMRA